MKKRSPWFKVDKISDPALLIHKNQKMGELWATYVDGKPHWIVEINGLTYTYPVTPNEPESFLIHIVEEAAYRLGNVVTLKIDPGRIKGLQVKPGTTSDEIKPFVDHLVDWRNNKEYWLEDLEWQKYIAR